MTEASGNKTAGKIWADYNPVRITSGPGAIDRLFSLDPPVAAGKRIFMVTSAGFSTRGVVEQIEAKARKKGMERPILVFDGVTPNPELDLLDRIATGLRNEGITGIIALGGGSVLDTAKAISVALPSDLEAPLDMVLRQGRPHQWKSRIPVVAVPTTAGTGAEVTPFATVWDSENNKKYSVSGEMVYPVHALLDPELTLTLPQKETLYTGLDAISHALESLWNKNRTPVSEALALKALTLANEALPDVLNQPDSLYFREMMQQASLLAGLAISRTRTAIAHAISYPLTMQFGVPHGLACSFILPELIKHYTTSSSPGWIKTLMRETLKTLESLNLKNEITHYIGKEGLSQYVSEMFHHERAINYENDMTKEGLISLLER